MARRLFDCLIREEMVLEYSFDYRSTRQRKLFHNA